MSYFLPVVETLNQLFELRYVVRVDETHESFSRKCASLVF